MALKFQCKNCGKDIAVRSLQVGEAAECKYCWTTNLIPESAESIDEEAAESMATGSSSESEKGVRDEPVQSVPMAKALHIIGIISIGFGVIVGIVLLILFNQPVELPFMISQAELTLIEVAVALGTTFFYCAYGVLCLGIAKILELLSK